MPEVETVRALFLIPANTDSKHIGEHDVVRSIATKHDIAVAYLRYFPGNIIERSDPPEFADQGFGALLQMLKDLTDREEMLHVPWITLGKSSRGCFLFRTTWWYPNRVIASIM